MISTGARLVLGLVAAGLVASSGAAYTDANGNADVDSDYVGHGSVGVTGVTLENISYDIDPLNSALLETITIRVTEDINEDDYNAVLGINGTGTADQRTCVIGTHVPDEGTLIECTVTDAVQDIDSVDLTVAAEDPDAS